MKLYSRQLIALKLDLSLSTLRRYLNKADIQPTKILKNKTLLPVYLYSLQSLLKISLYTTTYRNRSKTGQHKCSICKKPVAVNLLYGTRCQSCYIQRYSLPLIFGDKPWLRMLNKDLVKRAVSYLQTFIHPTKSDSTELS